MRDISLLIDLVVYQFRLIFVYWVAGIIAGAAVSVFLGPRLKQLTANITGKRNGAIAVVLAALLGAASPMCMYGTIPLIAALGRKGMPEYVISSFMVSSILINPNLFVFSSLALGFKIALIRLGASILAGLMAGALTAVFFRKKGLYNFDGFESKKRCGQAMHPVGKFFDEVNRTIVKTFPYLLAGIVLTAISNRYVQSSELSSLFGKNNGWGVVLASFVSVPLYMCGGGTIPIIKAWLENGMSLGAALSFMLGGPATKLNNLSAVKTILGTRNFLIYLAYSVAFSLIAGWTVSLACMVL